MWCFSCFKNGPSQDDLQIEKAIQNSLADEQARITRQKRLADEEFARALQDRLNLEEEEERQRTKDLENDAEMARVIQHEEETKERERQLNKSALDEEDKQISRIIEESLKERGKRKQFEDQVEEDKQFAMIVQASLNMEESPPRLEENKNTSPIALQDEDEQLDKVLWESLKEKGQVKHSKDQVEEDEQFPYAGHILNPTLSMCEGCNSEIEHGRSVNLLDAVWHPECFCCLACHKQIAVHEFSNSRGRFHRVCYREHRHPNCYVCKEKIPSTAKGIKYNEHPFWKDKYCPSHDVDGTAKCCSCEKLEPLGTNYVMLDDERRLCLECIESAVMDTDECHSLHIEIREFFEGLNMKIEKEFPVFLVEKQALNKAEEKEKIQDHHRAVVTRGLCLAEEQIVRIVSRKPSRRGPNNQLIGMATEYQRLFRKCEVIAILVLYGLPRLLTGSILAHEMMHAWLRLNGYRNLRAEVEEGLCQVLGHMWLESQTYSSTDAAIGIASSSSAPPPPVATTLKKGDPSDFGRRLVEFCKNQIETDDSPIYGLGFKKVNQMVTQYSLQETLREIKLSGLK